MVIKPTFDEVILDNIKIFPLEKPVNVYDYLRLYNGVGRKWNWIDRVILNEEELKKIVNSENNCIFTFHINNSEAGFAEFVNYKQYIEIQYFGLYNEFTGKGYGKKLFKWCINKAWSWNPQWIQLNTCDLDHNSALGLYKKSGFKEYKTEITERKIFI